MQLPSFPSRLKCRPVRNMLQPTIGMKKFEVLEMNLKGRSQVKEGVDILEQSNTRQLAVYSDGEQALNWASAVITRKF